MTRFVSLFFLLAFLGSSATAQPIFSGQIPDWSNGEAQILFADMFSKVTAKMGTVQEDGSFIVDVKGDFVTWSDTLAERMRANADQGFTLNDKTVASSFQCNDEPVVYVNGESVVMGIPDLAVADEEEQQFFGTLYATNSPKIASWMNSWGFEDPTTGYYLRWYYLESDASAHGECSIATYTGAGEEQFEKRTTIHLDLKKGWNIVKHEIAEVYTDKNGTVRPSLENVTTIDSPPDDLIWVVTAAQ